MAMLLGVVPRVNPFGVVYSSIAKSASDAHAPLARLLMTTSLMNFAAVGRAKDRLATGSPQFRPSALT